jgi:hypothetical protein
MLTCVTFVAQQALGYPKNFTAVKPANVHANMLGDERAVKVAK